MIRIFATRQGLVLERNGETRRPRSDLSLDWLFEAAEPVAAADEIFAAGEAADPPAAAALLAPIGSQEVWAAGVTYLRSKTARMEEARDAGGGDFYDKVYEAERPEIFFKATPQRVVGPNGEVRIRSDSKWNVPEPELTLALNASGRYFGFSIGNDMSSRDIEGQNPLYLPQAKTYAASAGLGPCLVVTDELPGRATAIRMDILRGGSSVFSGETNVGQIKRSLESLAEFLFRDNTFPHGAWLMTGTGIVPPDSFTLEHGDEIRIMIEPAGTLRQIVG